MARRISILVLLALTLTLAPTSTANNARNKKPRPSDGDYTLRVGGYLHGDGTATVYGTQPIRLTLRVAPAKGGAITSIEVTLKYAAGPGHHVSGDQTIFDTPAHFEGRLDIPDDVKERAIRGVRLVCRIKSAKGQYASVIGYIPALAEAEDEIDRQDRGKGPKKD